MKRRFLISGILSMCLAGLLVYLAGRALVDFQHPDRYVWYLRSRSLHEPLPSVLILGDSQAMSGIRPDLFPRPETVTNLALPSAQPEAFQAFLPALANSNVSLLIVNISPYSMYDTDVMNSFLNYYRSEWIQNDWPSPLRDHYLYGESAGEALGTVLSGLGLYRLNHAVRNMASDQSLSVFTAPGSFPGLGLAADASSLSRPLQPFKVLTMIAGRNRQVAEIMEATGGYWVWRDFRMPSTDLCDASDLNRLPSGVRFRERPAAREAWTSFLNQASTKVDRILVVQIPFSKSWHESIDSQMPEQKISSDIEAIRHAVSANNVEFLPAPDGFDDSDFNDWNHLDYCGAGKFTSHLLDELRASKK